MGNLKNNKVIAFMINKKNGNWHEEKMKNGISNLEKLDFKKWYFGHYHDNKQVNDQYVLLYEDIIPLGFKSIFEKGLEL